MSTSANVVEYTITKNGERAGRFRKHLLCKFPEYSELLKYEPLDEHEITAWGYDEEEAYWENDPVPLGEYLRRMAPFERALREYFENNDKK